MAYNPETGTTSQGERVDEAALANLKEATTLDLEEFPSGVSSHPLVTMFSVRAHAVEKLGFSTVRQNGNHVNDLSLTLLQATLPKDLAIDNALARLPRL